MRAGRSFSRRQTEKVPPRVIPLTLTPLYSASCSRRRRRQFNLRRALNASQQSSHHFACSEQRRRSHDLLWLPTSPFDHLLPARPKDVWIIDCTLMATHLSKRFAAMMKSSGQSKRVDCRGWSTGRLPNWKKPASDWRVLNGFRLVEPVVFQSFAEFSVWVSILGGEKTISLDSAHQWPDWWRRPSAWRSSSRAAALMGLAMMRRREEICARSVGGWQLWGGVSSPSTLFLY